MVIRSSLARAADELIRTKHRRLTLTKVIVAGYERGDTAEDIARRIWMLTDEVINISGRTMRRWIERLIEEGEAA